MTTMILPLVPQRDACNNVPLLADRLPQVVISSFFVNLFLMSQEVFILV